MSELDEFKATYFDECSELLNELEEQFAAIEGGDRGADRLNAVFRAIHSIKGGGGAFGFADLVGFAHAYESLLDQVRDGRVALTNEVVALCIRANDIVADHIEAARSDSPLDAGYGQAEKERFESLCHGEGNGDDEGMEEFDIDFTPVRVDLEAVEDAEPVLETLADTDTFGEATIEEPSELKAWRVTFQPHRDLYARANDPLLLLRELSTLGEAKVTAHLGEVPALSGFDPFAVYCHWTIDLVSGTAGETEIREVFEFVEGDCDITVEPLDSQAEDAPSAPAAESTDSIEAFDQGFGDLLAEAELDPPKSLSLVEETQADEALSAEAQKAAPPQAPVASGVSEDSGRGAGMQSIRVDLDKVDRVVNMVGELVITQSMLTQQMDETLRARYTELVRGLEVLAQTTRGLQDSVMAIRAQPVKSVFSRMPRLVRELATKTGKKIRLETIGEQTEIDKTVIEQLSDPLTHMIRNSADHGIEQAEKRLAKGKSETGTIRLSAEQAGGNILIIVEDDGAGINRERVLNIAREKGIVAPEQQMSDEQIDQLIFAPGFSTAEAVSDISGRGVGMDVVLANIKKIGGSVHVRSWPGQGTRMTLRLPLTLAVLDVMLVRLGGSPYVVPLSSIVETMQCARIAFERTPTGGQVMQVRGDYVQVIDLAKRFDMPTDVAPESRFVVLCEAEGGVKVALVVDDIIGQQQVVIKSLEENFERVEGIAGGTILGDGNVALIVDVQGLRGNFTHQNAA
ncbi:chemotaxis protein CheA [Devosia pacifica]|uniref:Chemotaxis protein CheA n=1 Tax=Devosia pacifica TaxID=1335967 RepID=A0A918S5L9_9HYPH|nr:chemotaxis protein CheA [Devosia pacifica]GHA25686.1 chemotaxis protein CheA [Devosia pacifica]